MKVHDDRALVKKCIDGDADAWSEFVDRYSGLIFWAIRRKLNKFSYAYLENEIEDIYQRTFTSIWEKKSLITVSDRGSIAPWLVVVASNITLTFIRAKCFEADILRSESELRNQSKDEREFIDIKENKKILGEAIKRLNDKERSYLELYYRDGKKYKEIAGIFNTSINNVSTIIARAKSKVRQFVEWKKYF